MIEAQLNLVVALPAEAKAINRILKLRRVQPDLGPPLYAGNDIRLVLTGPGLNAVQAGIKHLGHPNLSPHARWMNIGIAGHAKLPLGQAIMASQVVDTCHGRHWDLQPLPCPDCRQLPVHSVTTAVSDYPEPAAYDMEAAGFIATALKFAPLAKLQVLKIISDNRAHPSQAISARMVTDLLLQQATLIRQLINRMRYDHDPLSTP